MTRIRVGWLLTKKSWKIIRTDSSLLFFPVLSATSILIAALLVFGVGTAAVTDNSPQWLYWLIVVVFVYCSTTLGVYFNVALAACANRSMEGKDTAISEGLSAANSRIGAIIGWAAVAATIGLLLRLIAEQFRLVGEFVTMIFGAAWSVAAFFAIPVIALEGQGPIATLKRSVAIVKQRWGEGLTGYVAISLIALLVEIGTVLFVGALVMLAFSAGIDAIAIALIILGLLALMSLMIVSTAMVNVFRVAVYRYAMTSKPQALFSAQDLETAFQQQKIT